MYLVDEYRTSARCSKCMDQDAKCSTFLEVKNPRPYRRVKCPTIIRHGLVKCSNCKTYWNRDTNAAINIYKICYNEINNLGRPEYLRRQQPAAAREVSAQA